MARVMSNAPKGKDSVELPSCQSNILKEPRQAGPSQLYASGPLMLNSSSLTTVSQLQGENIQLRDENAQLREQMRLTTHQLNEAMAALARAMNYIQRVRSTHACSTSQTSAQTESVITTSTAHIQSEPTNVCYKRTEGPQRSQATTDDATADSAVSSRHHIALNSEPSLRDATNLPRTSDNSKISSTSTAYAKKDVHSASSRKKIGRLPQGHYESWLRSALVGTAGNEILQRDVWEVYKETFPKFAPECPLSIPSDLMKLVVKVFPRAQCLSVGVGGQIRFVVRGLAWNVRN